MTHKIPFNKPYMSGKELEYISDAVMEKKLSGNGKYTKLCHAFFEKEYAMHKCLLTSSCTDALEMGALLARIEPGDEVIMPAYTFVSTANAFVLRGAKIVFCDSRKDHPGMDEDLIESLITAKTKAIVPVHYAGVACDMDKIMAIAKQYNLFVLEDAAQAIDSYYTNANGDKLALGSIGDAGAFSFHETKNIISGEGGLLAINREDLGHRGEILWEKGTNRSSFYRGEVNKYGWVDLGSSFLPSEITAAYLWAQLEQKNNIQQKRLAHWQYYYNNLKEWAVQNGIGLPYIPEYATNNAHVFYLVFQNIAQRNAMIAKMRENQIDAVFHYLSLHKSPYYSDKHKGGEMPESDRYTDCLLRLPLFYELEKAQMDLVIETLQSLKNVQPG